MWRYLPGALGLVILCLCLSCADDLHTPSDHASLTRQEAQLTEKYLRSEADALRCVGDFLQSPSGELRGNAPARKPERVIDLSASTRLCKDLIEKRFADCFYVVTLSENKGYAFVSKDKRCFPIYAVLDDGAFRYECLEDPFMKDKIRTMVSASALEKSGYDKWAKEMHSPLRSEGVETALQDMLLDDWTISRQTKIRTETTWGQHIMQKDLYINKDGLTYEEAYSKKAVAGVRSSMSEADFFGCTPVAFGQVMYALREFDGFRTLCYSNGERILWDRMSKKDSDDIEVQRFLGWFTANCSPTYFKKGTMVFNIKATNFLRGLVGSYINSRYDNCVVTAGDFNGYGWSEDKRVAEDFFNHDHAFVIMTASPAVFDINYHTFVVDGMEELKKRVKSGAFLGLSFLSKWMDGVRHLYHVNAGWEGRYDGYFLYVQNVDNVFGYTGKDKEMDYRSKTAYVILWPNQEN